MELDADYEIEFFDTIFYTKNIKDNNDLCLVCLVDEREEGQHWEKYMTRCGHVSHTRCYRRWCFKKQKIHCPLCGDIAPVKKNRYCWDCKRFGHNACVDNCPKNQP